MRKFNLIKECRRGSHAHSVASYVGLHYSIDLFNLCYTRVCTLVPRIHVLEKNAYGIMHDHIEDAYIKLCKSTLYLESKCSTLLNPSDIVYVLR